MMPLVEKWVTVMGMALYLGVTCVIASEAGTDDLHIAAFNVQVFGRTKMSKPEVVDTLVKIVQRYDIILIQEIRDISGESIVNPETARESPVRYSMVISERLGRTSSKEQYAFLYRQGKDLSVRQTYQYADHDDHFEREPFSVHFNSPHTEQKDFVLAAIHVDPDEAVEEINALDAAHDDITSHFGTDNIIILGDLNADCKYVSGRALSELTLRTDPKYVWLIDDNADTTVTTGTDCAYDRFIVTGQELVSGITPQSADVFLFDQHYGLTYEEAKAVSDHYPIHLSLLGATVTDGDQGETESGDGSGTGSKNSIGVTMICFCASVVLLLVPCIPGFQ